jgi:thymidylate synthase
MTVALQADNFEKLFADLVYHANEEPEYTCSPRSQKVRELIAPTITLTDPRARLLASPARKADYGFAVGEFLWYWTGKRDLESMLYYNKRMGQFSDDGVSLNSAYGHRMKTKSHTFVRPYPDFPMLGSTTQWQAIKKTLLEDPDSRRALLIIGRAEDYSIGAYVPSKDLPCTLSLQFFIRENKLRLHTMMRSNDIVWGLSYDLFSFTLLQECMMLELRAAGMKDLELGTYTHTAGSMHIYERHFSMASAVVSNYLQQKFQPAAPMLPIDLGELASLVEDEEALRTGKKAVLDESRYTGGVCWMGAALNRHRAKRDAERGG